MKGTGTPKRIPERAPGPRRPSGGLNSKERKQSETLPGGRFPMPDKNHARNALARLDQAKNITPAEKAKVRGRADRMLGEPKGGKKK